jgi:DTW domain-containing protein YfiP
MARTVCPQCSRPATVCYCHTIKVIHNHWPVMILQHPKETHRAIGTAKIAQLSLVNCRTEVADKLDSDDELGRQIAQQRPYLLYPGENSSLLQDMPLDTIRPLLFIDGTWRKTRRMLYESPLLSTLRAISFTPQQPSRYRIRKEPDPTAISTIEAIATVLETVESAPGKYQPMLASMDWIIEQQIAAMGQTRYQRNYTPLT